MNPDFDYQVNASIAIEALQQVAYKAYAVYQSVLEPHHWETLKTNLNNLESLSTLREKATLVSCSLNGKVIGAAYLMPSGNPTHVYTDNQSYIRVLGIDPAFSGNGIARKLTEMCIDQARANGETEIALHTSEFMDAARHLYESIGFTQVREIDPVFGKRYWLYRLSL